MNGVEELTDIMKLPQWMTNWGELFLDDKFSDTKLKNANDTEHYQHLNVSSMNCSGKCNFTSLFFLILLTDASLC